MTEKIKSEDFIKAFGSGVGAKVENIPMKMEIGAGKCPIEAGGNCPLRPQGECKSCRHRDPEDKKCDCGGMERQGCIFPVSDNYYCKYYER